MTHAAQRHEITIDWSKLPQRDIEIAAVIHVWPQTVGAWRRKAKRPSRLAIEAIRRHWPEAVQ